ncbi:hypothetical protein CAEBREN_25547 [Caenorhabditis brenneri]|uniref:Uncharacterized protein n=1 Tax=Caenorhabditis brenneri TaxID=135651 RepID=G0N119_CAEBE|nr:hypothetical protein CAEBREN_25547 [Caenorhabditis brenneri]
MNSTFIETTIINPDFIICKNSMLPCFLFALMYAPILMLFVFSTTCMFYIYVHVSRRNSERDKETPEEVSYGRGYDEFVERFNVLNTIFFGMISIDIFTTHFIIQCSYLICSQHNLASTLVCCGFSRYAEVEPVTVEMTTNNE